MQNSDSITAVDYSRGWTVHVLSELDPGDGATVTLRVRRLNHAELTRTGCELCDRTALYVIEATEVLGMGGHDTTLCQAHADYAAANGDEREWWELPVTRLPFIGDAVPADRSFKDRACLAKAPGAVGDCIRPKRHVGPHQGAAGYSWMSAPSSADAIERLLAGDPWDQAQAMARATGAVGATVRIERRAADGSLTVEAEESYGATSGTGEGHASEAAINAAMTAGAVMAGRDRARELRNTADELLQLLTSGPAALHRGAEVRKLLDTIHDASAALYRLTDEEV